MTYYRGRTVRPSPDPTVHILTTLLITAPKFQRCFLKEWLWVKGLEGLRGIGALELSTQHFDETQRIQYEQNKKPTSELRSPES